MSNDRFDELMNDAAETFRRPIEPPIDEMWKAIEAEAFGTRPLSLETRGQERSRWFTNRWVQVAATLVVGVTIGRASSLVGRTTPAQPAAVPTVAATTEPAPRVETVAMDAPYQEATNKYLDQTAALLVSLPSEVKAGRSAQFVDRAGELLTTTRVLLDSPAAQDQSMRTLLEDLEMVLAQVVRLQGDRGSKELDFINQALKQRDVIPRLRSAVADISAN
jgi:hypothetical protein